jgi:hypothetical protein
MGEYITAPAERQCHTLFTGSSAAVHNGTQDYADDRTTGTAEKDTASNRLEREHVVDNLTNQIVGPPKQITNGDEFTGERRPRKDQIADNQPHNTEYNCQKHYVLHFFPCTTATVPRQPFFSTISQILHNGILSQ